MGGFERLQRAELGGGQWSNQKLSVQYRARKNEFAQASLLLWIPILCLLF